MNTKDTEEGEECDLEMEEFFLICESTDEENDSLIRKEKPSEALLVISGFLILLQYALQEQILPPILPYLIERFRLPRNSTAGNGTRQKSELEIIESMPPIDKSFVAWTVSVYNASGMLIVIFGGFITACLSYKITIIVSLVTSSIAMVLTPYVSNYVHFLYGVGVFGAFSALSYSAILSTTSEMIKSDKRRNKIFAIIMVAKTVGLVLGTPMGSLMYQYTGELGTFIMSAVLTISAVPFVYFLKIRQKRNEDFEEVSTAREYRNAFSDGYIIVLLLLVFLCGSAYNIQSVVQNQHLEEDLGTSLTNMTILSCIAVWFQIAATYIATIEAPFMPKRWALLLLAMMGTGLSFMIYSVCGSMWDCVGAEVVFRTSSGIIFVVAPSLVTVVATIRHNGRSDVLFSLFTACETFGNSIGPFIAGLAIFEQISFERILVFTGGLMIVASLLSAMLRQAEIDLKKMNREENQ